MKTWELYYKSHFIKITNGFFSGSVLFVDGDIQDFISGFSINKKMSGEIKIGNGAGDRIKIRLTLLGKHKCIIFINETILLPTFK
ncbi:MAG: hypothetical protein A2X12_03635 [Bacteroidetes bacterium GWE2_29_8]|nr:MAG: hypothetical protein A2X12_03635 [Bacteroidetes bacterium GWE2_29_8]